MPKRLWGDIPINDKKKLVYKVRRALSKYVVTSDIPKLVKAVFTKKFDQGVYSRSMDYDAKCSIVDNIARELAIIGRKEHQSGVFRAFVSACYGNNISAKELAKQLRIHRNTVAKAIKWRHVRRTGVIYRKIIKKPVIKRVKKAPQLDDACKRFMDSVFVPSR